MKKFSTAALSLPLALGMAFALPGHAAPDGAARPDSQAAQAASSRCAFLPNAPDQHVVVRGDTLWDISGKFLKHAWCWPQVWGMNREEIRNPHWIYPGQVVIFDRAAGRLRLGNAVGSGAMAGSGMAGGIQTVKLSPQLRTQGLGQDAVPAIPSNIIEPFLSKPLVVGEDDLKNAARIVATPEGRVNVAKDDKVYVRGDIHAGTSFQVFRPGTPLKDPVTGNIRGYEATYLGTIKLDRAARADNEAHAFYVVDVKQEMGVGDRLLPVPPTPILNYVPHPPERQLDARVMSVYGGVTQAGQNQIVSINRGKDAGLDMGTVLELYQTGRVIRDKTDPGGWSIGTLGKPEVKIPDNQYGSLFIFRVFDNISYGLVMQVTEPVQIGDIAKSPE
ncbi:LysM peptidoglycan-binding domain-containing protein [Noviherbaspirillum galbum]|uniref:LysM peptidoglycan-binding domain-containing protein n=1 Tax=Noviherbaspirillum galbum TaxID=2709383 RepID=A0A6B3ST38_9BURK|nr:LysM peptidoglycan-binding domain-containing protein [Noviherbaspirillum galbum]NEX63824.1 LysM peptidoglycan-binding domain-containing protein [Noviherbaspirillum galbum]